MLFVTDAKVQAVIDKLLTQSEGLVPSIRAIIERPRSVTDPAARRQKATEIVVDAKLIHEDLLSLAGQFRLKVFSAKVAYFQTEVLERRLKILTAEAAAWTGNY